MASTTTLRPAFAGGGILNAPLIQWLHKNRGLIVPAGFICMVMVLLVPLPPMILDVLLVLNLAIAAIVLVSVMFVRSPLELLIAMIRSLGVKDL